MESESSTSRRYAELSDDELEAKIRRATLERGLSLLEGAEDLPPGQLIALIGKLGIADEKAEPDKKKQTAEMGDAFAVLKGLPTERREALLNDLQMKVDAARKESPNG